MQGKEPSACLIHALGNEICGEHLFKILLANSKGVVELGIGHCAGVEPHINKVGLAEHFLSFG